MDICNLSPHLHSSAILQTTKSIVELRIKKSCGTAIADLQNLTSSIPQLSAVPCQFRYFPFPFPQLMMILKINQKIGCCQTAVGVGQRALSLSAHTAGGPPPTPGTGEGGVSLPYSRSIANTTVTSLLRGAGGFNHLRESLNPSLHTGGPCRGRSFRCRLRRWRWWYGSWSVEMTLYLYVGASEYVTARLR